MNSGQSLTNSFVSAFHIKQKYFSTVGKGELIYPVLSPSPCCCIKNGKLVSLAEVKR